MSIELETETQFIEMGTRETLSSFNTSPELTSSSDDSEQENKKLLHYENQQLLQLPFTLVSMNNGISSYENDGFEISDVLANRKISSTVKTIVEEFKEMKNQFYGYEEAGKKVKIEFSSSSESDSKEREEALNEFKQLKIKKQTSDSSVRSDIVNVKNMMKNQKKNFSEGKKNENFRDNVRSSFSQKNRGKFSANGSTQLGSLNIEESKKGSIGDTKLGFESKNTDEFNSEETRSQNKKAFFGEINSISSISKCKDSKDASKIANFESNGKEKNSDCFIDSNTFKKSLNLEKDESLDSIVLKLKKTDSTQEEKLQLFEKITKQNEILSLLNV